MGLGGHRIVIQDVGLSGSVFEDRHEGACVRIGTSLDVGIMHEGTCLRTKFAYTTRWASSDDSSVYSSSHSKAV